MWDGTRAVIRLNWIFLSLDNALTWPIGFVDMLCCYRYERGECKCMQCVFLVISLFINGFTPLFFKIDMITSIST